MRNAERGMGKEKWRMADDRWQMADDKWQMADGGWQMPRRSGPSTFPGCQKVAGPWYVVSLREFLLLTAPSGLLCGNWDFSSSFPRRCSHGYQVQVKNSSIASLSHHRQAFRIAPPAGSEGRPRALRYRGRGLCQGSFQVDARRFLRTHPHPTQRGRTQQAGL